MQPQAQQHGPSEVLRAPLGPELREGLPSVEDQSCSYRASGTMRSRAAAHDVDGVKGLFHGQTRLQMQFVAKSDEAISRVPSVLHIIGRAESDKDVHLTVGRGWFLQVLGCAPERKCSV